MAANYTYWISTTLLALLYLTSAALYIVKRDWVRQTLAELNYPAPYLVPLMVVVKVLGPLAFSAGVQVNYDSLPAEGKGPTDVIYTSGMELAF